MHVGQSDEFVSVQVTRDVLRIVSHSLYGILKLRRRAASCQGKGAEFFKRIRDPISDVLVHTSLHGKREVCYVFYSMNWSRQAPEKLQNSVSCHLCAAAKNSCI